MSKGFSFSWIAICYNLFWMWNEASPDTKWYFWPTISAKQ